MSEERDYKIRRYPRGIWYIVKYNIENGLRRAPVYQCTSQAALGFFEYVSKEPLTFEEAQALLKVLNGMR